MLKFLRKLFGRQREPIKKGKGADSSSPKQRSPVASREATTGPTEAEVPRQATAERRAESSATVRGGVPDEQESGRAHEVEKEIPPQVGPPSKAKLGPEAAIEEETVIYLPQSSPSDSARRGRGVDSEVPPSLGRKQKTIIDIGLDFGTSFSKVVLRAPFIQGGIAWAAPVGDKTRDDIGQFLRPTPRADGNESLKVALMRVQRNDSLELKASRFLSHLMTDARQWLEGAESRLLNQYEVDWRVAVGCASQTEGGVVVDTFLRIARRAAEMAGQAAANTIVIPEVAASAIGYANSDQRRPDPLLHLLMDVGASTVDICGFVLTTREGEDQYNILFPSVENLGAFNLHQERLKCLAPGQIASRISMLDLSDPASAIPSECAAYCNDGEVPNALNVASEDFRKQCVVQLMECIHALKTRRDPHSPAWQEGLPLLYTGGASAMAFYSRVHELAQQRMHTMGARGFRIKALPMPYELKNDTVPNDIFLRLGTAYGLSYFDRSGNVRWEGEFADIPGYERRASREFIDKDYV